MKKWLFFAIIVLLPFLIAWSREVELTTDDGLTLVGEFLETNSPLAPAILLLHPLGEQKESWDGFINSLNDNGFFVLALDLRAHGASQGKGSWLYFTGDDFVKMVLDVKAGVDFLRAQPGVNRDAIVIIGAELGGSLALLYAVDDPGIRGVVILSPGLDYCGLDLHKAAEGYKNRPLFLIFGEEDVYSSYSAKVLKEMVGESCKLEQFPAAGHGTKMLFTNKELVGRIIEWLLKVVP